MDRKYRISDLASGFKGDVAATQRMETDAQGKRFKPLKKGQIGMYDEAAKATNNNLTRLTGRTLLHTGLRNGAYCHAQPQWLADERILEKPVLRVPWHEDCIGGVGQTGKRNAKGKNLRNRGEPCYKCRTNRDGYWEPKTENAPRPLPVMDEDIYESLENWFANHEQIPLLHGAVINRVQQIADEAGLNRRVKPHDLRHTYGTVLARMDVKPAIIASVMGHGSLDQSFQYIKFVGRDIMSEFKDKWDYDLFE